MPSDLTPEFWVNLSATIFFAATVGIMLWDIHTQKKGLRQEAYEELRNDHADIVQIQLNDNDLDIIWQKVDKPTNVDESKWAKSETKERKIFLFYVLIFDLYERLHWEIIHGEVLDNYKERTKEWGYWIEWLTKISKHWLFEYTFFSVFPVYQEDFVRNITDRFFSKKMEKLNHYWKVKEEEKDIQQRQENWRTYLYTETELQEKIKKVQEKASKLQNELKIE